MKIRPANEEDLLKLFGWFLTESEVKSWGGPSIHFPLSLEQLKIDIEWNVAHSYALIEKSGDLLGFAQAFNKFGCKHLGRIVVSPKMRGRKLGYKLMAALFDATGTNDLSFSLFVYEDNIPAKRLYESIGFEVRACPEGRPEIKDCIFMVKET